MRLFLASQDFGNHANRLREMVGDNRKALVIFNQRDYETPQDRKAVVERKRKLFTENGFQFEELDLRKFFAKKNELRKFINDYRPGLITATGGNTYLLKSAYDQSGFSEILLEDLANDKYVYSGHSGGAMVTSPDYNYYDIGDRPEIIRNIYGLDPDYTGLGLIGEYILPHADQDWYRADFEANLKNMRDHSIEPIILNDSDVFVVDGRNREILR